MTIAHLFPGQGSQYVGMGKDLFPRFGTLVDQASDLLGYSVTALCLEDARKELNLTQFTQPALYVVSVLSYLALCEDENKSPDYVAGHSLGEYGALFAAGCFDFMTGLTLVRERARLMSEVSGSGMVAITQIDSARLSDLIENDPRFRDIDIANYNTRLQTVISGSSEQLRALAEVVQRDGGRYFALNVSGAFHSRLMTPARQKFVEFAAGVTFRAPRITVIANVSASPYPSACDAIRSTLVRQITSPVRWLETITRLHRDGVEQFVEVGPGRILSRLNESILTDLERSDATETTQAGAAAVSAGRSSLGGSAKAIFICPGQGGQHYRMGRLSYSGNAAFRKSFDACDRLAQPLIGESIAAIVYRTDNPAAEFSRTLHTQIANFAFAYSTVAALRADGVDPVCYVAWSLGEYVALAAGGALTLEAAITLVARQALEIEARTVPAAMLSVHENVNIFYSLANLFAECTLAGIHTHKDFVVTGKPDALAAISQALAEKGIACHALNVSHGFHSALLDATETTFRADCAMLARRNPTTPFYSSVQRGVVDVVDDDYLWDICRSRFNFQTALILAAETYPGASWYDVGPSGASARYAKALIGNRAEIYHSARNLSTQPPQPGQDLVLGQGSNKANAFM